MVVKPTYEELERRVKELEQEAVKSRQAKEELRKSEAQFRTLFSRSRDANLLLLDGVHVDCNEACLDMLRATREQVIGKSPAAFSPERQPDGRLSGEAAAEKIHEVMETGSARFEWVHRRTDGTQFWTEVVATAIDIDGGIGLFGVWRDITETKRVVEELQESESKLREAHQMAHLGHWFWDVSSGSVEWSDEVFKIFQLDPKEFTPQIDSILDLSPWPEDHQRDKELIERAVENRQPGSYEQRFFRPDGSMGYYFSTFRGIYDPSGKLIAMKGTVQDITERKEAEEALAASVVSQ